MSIPSFSGKCYPDKSFTLGAVPKKKIRREDSEYERLYRQQEPVNWSNITDWLIGSLNIGGKFCSLSEGKKDLGYEIVDLPERSRAIEIAHALDGVKDGDYSSYYDELEDMAKPLFIVSPKSSRKPRGAYGKNGITNFGRRFLKNACICLEDRYGKKRLGFGTATLPAMDRDTCDAINGSISDITRRFYQKIRRIYKKRGQQFIYVGCVEIQEERFRSSGIAAAHLHFVYVAKSHLHTRYTCNTKEFYTAWNQSVNEVLRKLGRKPIMGVGGHKGSVKLESIRTSAAAYIGKYVSKGVKSVEAMQKAGYAHMPKQWWTACMQCKRMYANAVIHLSHDACDLIWNNTKELVESELVENIHYVYVDIGGYECCMGLSGTVSDIMYSKLKEGVL